MSLGLAFRADPKIGVVYTRPAIVSLALDLVNYRSSRDLSGIRVLDVGCGYGQFVGEVARRLVASCVEGGLGPGDAVKVLRRCVRGVEINQETASAARGAVFLAFRNAYGASAEYRTSLRQTVQEADFLDHIPDIQEFDLVVGNLPFVKYGAIGKLPRPRSLDWIRDHYHCFRGRADYSIALFERSLQLLSEAGEAAIISSNRFTRAEYGKGLRELLAASGFELHELDLGRIRAFDENVTSYSSLFLLLRGNPGYSRYVRLNSMEPQGLTHLVRRGPRHVRSSKWYLSYSRNRLSRDGSPWAPFPFKVVRLLKRLKKTLPSVAERGITIRKGPATGADHVFIQHFDQFPLEDDTKAEFLLPLFRSGSCKLPPSQIPDRHLLSLYEAGTKRLLSLEELPEDLQQYLHTNRDDLERRHLVREQHREWWRTIDPFDPDLKSQKKVLIPDLQRGKAIRVDEGHLFPGHTVLYSLGPEEELDDFAHLLKAPLADLFRTWHSPSMRNGTPRASPKVLSSFPCPDLQELDGRETGDESFEDVYLAYGLREDEVRAITKAHSFLLSS